MSFKIGSPIYEFMMTFAHFVLLNLLFILTCLPIITIGPALAALYYVTIKESREETTYIKDYLTAFRTNFKQGLIAMLIFIITAGIFLFNITFWLAMGTGTGKLVFILLLIVTLLLFVCFIYTFPLMGRYKNPLKQTLKNALLIGIQNFKMTLILTAIFITAAYLTLFFKPVTLLMLLFGFAFVAYCASYIFNKVFERYDSDIAE